MQKNKSMLKWSLLTILVLAATGCADSKSEGGSNSSGTQGAVPGVETGFTESPGFHSVSYQYSLPEGLPGVMHSIPVKAFDKALGRLMAIKVYLHGGVTATFRGENLGSVAVFHAHQTAYRFSAFDPNNADLPALAVMSLGLEAYIPLGAFDGLNDYRGTSGNTTIASGSGGSSLFKTVDSRNLTSFSSDIPDAMTQLNVRVDADSNSVFRGSMSSDQSTTVKLDFQLSYTYLVN